MWLLSKHAFSLQGGPDCGSLPVLYGKADTQYLFVTPLYCGKGPLIGRKEIVHPLGAGGLPELSRAMRTQVQGIFSAYLAVVK